ncbi:hypothetical protein AMTR_s00006p00220280 [Amborella trichopoda]|uniref:Cwf19-like protein C-terminal domain-containing protein n=1 Tax=Amborella trichopoda TaxID=13333 RepID=W1P754_AMBTC|nr:hypothetical protein AMTR_s00006p00220280 [Amborella trichopoda]
MAIDEAEEEWSQHNAKKLIDMSVKGGFVHVIDDEKQFKRNMGLNVVRGMLELPEEDMYRRRQHDSVETQRQAVSRFAREWKHVSRFAREWKHFDCTRALEE